jgi:hypothetical protein
MEFPEVANMSLQGFVYLSEAFYLRERAVFGRGSP